MTFRWFSPVAQCAETIPISSGVKARGLGWAGLLEAPKGMAQGQGQSEAGCACVRVSVPLR